MFILWANNEFKFRINITVTGSSLMKKMENRLGQLSDRLSGFIKSEELKFKKT